MSSEIFSHSVVFAHLEFCSRFLVMFTVWSVQSLMGKKKK